VVSKALFLGHNFVMKVLDLHCPQEHQFEGWFAGEDDYQIQLGRGLIECPMCGSQEVAKRLSAPRLNLLASKSSRTEGLSRHQAPLANGLTPQDESPAQSANETSSSATDHPSQGALVTGDQSGVDPATSAHRLQVQQQLQANWLKVVQQVLANTEDVGSQFADEARKIHYGEAQERNIRGQVSVDESMALLDEGIPVVPLMVPAALKGSVH
jgi:hypothetical protein